jgi:dipeptide/tripeptide permease
MNGTTVVDDADAWDDDEPTERERETLRKIPDALPASAFLVAVVELCERFAFYGMSGPFQNYIANKYHDPSGNPGAIGKINLQLSCTILLLGLLKLYSISYSQATTCGIFANNILKDWIKREPQVSPTSSNSGV